MEDLARGPIRVVGRYALYNEIAAGGMATIHLGRLLGPVGFARTVAIKRLHPQFAKDPEFVSMFLDEARLAARVQHPNVVATIDVVATDGELFLIMDYVRGESLSKILRAMRKAKMQVPPRIAASIMSGFLHGLHAAHEAKNERGELLDLIHRDVSPQNVLVGADGIARVLDFGIAKAAGRVQVTRDGQIKGKLAYMPPEQLAGRPLTRTVDVYAAGVVMWETLAADRLFKGETEAETLAKILHDDVPLIGTVAPAAKKFDAILAKALSRDPAKRFATARELAIEIERCDGIASTTEVGEWVETAVGKAIESREVQIAEIESNSTGLRVSGIGLDAELGRGDATPVSHRNGTLVGVGPPSGHLSTPHLASSGSGSDLPRVRPPMTSDSGTSKVTGTRSGTRTTGTIILPLDRRLPILASIAGLVVLVGIVIAIVAGKTEGGGATSDRGDASIGARSASSSATPPPEAAAAAPGAPRTDVVPEPPPPPTMGASSEAPPEKPAPRATAHAGATNGVVSSPPRASSATGANTGATAAAASAKRNCEPPYVIDGQGRKSYKRECL